MDSNTNTQTQNPALDVPAAWIGLDWGHRTHAFALQDTSGRTEEGNVEHTPEALHDWLLQLAARYGGRPVRLALEGKGGAALPALLEYPWLLHPVNPVTSARYRRTLKIFAARSSRTQKLFTVKRSAIRSSMFFHSKKYLPSRRNTASP